jgi:hypothetical protein
MQQIADWLQKLGLGQYAQRFAENDITFVILPDLTDQDLEKIGVASLGHRRCAPAAQTCRSSSPVTRPDLNYSSLMDRAIRSMMSAASSCRFLLCQCSTNTGRSLVGRRDLSRPPKMAITGQPPGAILFGCLVVRHRMHLDKVLSAAKRPGAAAL